MTQASGSRRVAVVCNPVKTDAATLRRRVEKASRKAGWAPPLSYETTPDDAGQDATARALHEGAAVIVVAGGDGTVRAVAEALASTTVPMAIVPSGTGNLLARNLRLPLADPETMVRAAFDGDVHGIDIGMAHVVRTDGSTADHAFIVMGGIGLDAAMIANTNPQLKKSMGWIAYIDGAARSLRGATPFRLAYELDDDKLRSTKVHSLLFANCGVLPAGISLIPDASFTDGEMDLAMIQPTGWFGWLAVWRRIWWENSVLRRTRAGRLIIERRENASVRYLRTPTIDVAVGAPQPVELDGDEFGEATRIRCHTLPGAVQVIVPHGHVLPGDADEALRERVRDDDPRPAGE